MAPEIVTIVLPLPNKVLQPNCTIGSFGGRMMRASATKRYKRQAREAIEAERIDTIPWNKVLVEAVFYHGTNRKRDEDNAMGALKAAYDGIVESGLISDDDSEHMQRGVPTFFTDKKFPRVCLLIERLE